MLSPEYFLLIIIMQRLTRHVSVIKMTNRMGEKEKYKELKEKNGRRRKEG